jgi:uncharacterized OB-fold protein
MAERPRPEPTDVSQPFWDAARDSRFLLQYDQASGRSQFFPRPVSLFGETEPAWRAAAGTGRLIAITTCRTPTPGFEAPYVVGIVALDEGARVFARLLNTASDTAPGQPMRLVWEATADGRRMYAFEPAASADASRT